MANDKLREALEDIVHGIEEKYAAAPTQVTPHEDAILHRCNAALAAPRLNCEVGTAEEQAERFENFCLKYIGCAEETGGSHCIGCPLEKASRHTTQKCELYWAQMPYEEGGAK